MSARLIHQLLARTETSSVDGLDWPQQVFVQKIPARGIFDAQSEDDPLRQMAKIIQLGACNEDGAPSFKPDDVEAIEKLPLPELETLVDAISQHNGLNGE